MGPASATPRVVFSLAVLALLTIVARPAVAQSTTATLQGSVADPGGGVIPGVTVRLESPATGMTREVVTNSAGAYVFNFLPAGSYVVTAELTGFKSVKHGDVTLEIGQTRELNVRLEIGRLEEVVDVAGTATVLDRTSGAIGTVIGSSQLKQLPLAGRHWATLMMLAPGAINTGDGTHLSIRFVGRARDDNNWTFDGVDATGVKDPRQDSSARLIISTESVAEFRVSSSMYSATSGTAAGGQVQLVSKTGSNEFHGTAYDFVRNDRFDAKPHTVLSLIASATALTDSKSPLEAAGNPASITSTRIRSSWRAMRTFSSRVIDAPGLCSPSRSVVSKIIR